jgi:hypothetical protein
VRRAPLKDGRIMLGKGLKASLFGVAMGAAMIVATPKAEAAFQMTYTGESAPSFISGSALFTFSDVGNDVQLALTLTNTSTATASRIVAFGFDLPTGYVNVQLTTDNDWNMVPGGDSIGGGGVSPTFDVCIESDSNNNCGGNNPTLGISQGAANALTFVFTIDTLSLASDFEASALAHYSNASLQPTSGMRFQSISGAGGVGSDRAFNGPPSDPDGPTDPGSIPEPMTLALFGLGLAGLGVASRRRKA